MKRLVAVCVTLGVASLMMVGGAWGESGQKMCIPEAPKKAILTPNGAGGCTNTKTTTYKLAELGKEGKEGLEGKIPFNTEEVALIKNLLPHIKYVASGIDTTPTIQFSAANVQVVDGLGHTESSNGEGNLVIGYDERTPNRVQEGSHNLVLGIEQNYFGWGGIVAGAFNSIGSYASVTGGSVNIAEGEGASVSGGVENAARGSVGLGQGPDASVSGGKHNEASGESSTVSGGIFNTASGANSSVSGGNFGDAVGLDSSVSGGATNTAAAPESWAGGGLDNNAAGEESAIFGGESLTTLHRLEAIP